MVIARTHRLLSTVKKDGAGALIIEQDKGLLIQRGRTGSSPYTWAPPGGRMDSGELPLDTAIRETLEEVNIDLSSYNFEDLVTQPSIDEVSVYHTFIYRFHMPMNFPVVIDHESEDWGWFTSEEMLNLMLHPGMHFLLSRVYF